MKEKEKKDIILDVIHMYSIQLIYSGLVDDKTCGEFSQLRKKILEYYGIVDDRE